jgi:hypothetical protein
VPSSPVQQLNTIAELIRLTDPGSMLDVGVGLGKYGLLARDYLELPRGRLQRQDWQLQIDGIEVFRAYANPLYDYVYDQIYWGDAAEIVPALKTRYDLALLVDVLEHFDYQEGKSFLADLLRVARNALISTPKEWEEQGPLFGNQFEQHRSIWRKQDFAQFEARCFIPNEFSLICYIGEDVSRIKHGMSSFAKRVKRNFPYLIGPKRLFERCLSRGSG